MSPAGIIESLCRALSDHAASHLPSLSSEHLPHLRRISTALRTICSNSAYETKHEMVNAREYLDRFDGHVTVGEIRFIVAGMAVRDAAIELTMEALVLAEARLQCADTNDNDDCAPMITSSTDDTNGTSVSIPLVTGLCIFWPTLIYIDRMCHIPPPPRLQEQLSKLKIGNPSKSWRPTKKIVSHAQILAFYNP